MTTIDSLLRRAVDVAPDRIALRWRDASMTYAELDRAVTSASHHLGRAEVDPGTRVALLTGNVPAAVVLLFATWRAGAVAVPLNDRLRADDRRAAFDAIDPALVVLVDRPDGAMPVPRDVAARPGVRQVLVAAPDGSFVGGARSRAAMGPATSPTAAEAVPADVGLVLTTSGSTGPPKAVLVTHAREVGSTDSMIERLLLQPDDVAVLAVSVSHAFGLSCLLASIAACSEAVLIDSTTSNTPLLDALERATVVHGSPTLFAALATGRRALPRQVRVGFAAGAASPVGLVERLHEAGLTVLNLYGMTEIGAAAASAIDDPLTIRASTSGRALAGHELRVVAGELLVRGAHVTPGYFRQPERTAAAFVDGWFHTGDLATIDRDGNVRVTGRLDDVVSVAGFNVSPAEIETCLLDHAGVRAVVVVGIPDDRLGHRLAAFVVPSGPQVEVRDLLQHLRQRLAGYKMPYRVALMDDLPRLATGKPDRRAVQALAAETAR